MWLWRKFRSIGENYGNIMDIIINSLYYRYTLYKSKVDLFETENQCLVSRMSHKDLPIDGDWKTVGFYL